MHNKETFASMNAETWHYPTERSGSSHTKICNGSVDFLPTSTYQPNADICSPAPAIKTFTLSSDTKISSVQDSHSIEGNIELPTSSGSIATDPRVSERVTEPEAKSKQHDDIGKDEDGRKSSVLQGGNDTGSAGAVQDGMCPPAALDDVPPKTSSQGAELMKPNRTPTRMGDNFRSWSQQVLEDVALVNNGGLLTKTSSWSSAGTSSELQVNQTHQPAVTVEQEASMSPTYPESVREVRTLSAESMFVFVSPKYPLDATRPAVEFNTSQGTEREMESLSTRKRNDLLNETGDIESGGGGDLGAGPGRDGAGDLVDEMVEASPNSDGRSRRPTSARAATLSHSAHRPVWIGV